MPRKSATHPSPASSTRPPARIDVGLEDLVAFGSALKSARELKGLSQQRLAELAGVTRQLIVRAEKGTRSIGLLVAIRIIAAVDGRIDLPQKAAPTSRVVNPR